MLILQKAQKHLGPNVCAPLAGADPGFGKRGASCMTSIVGSYIKQKHRTPEATGILYTCTSRHTIVCRAAQEAGVPHRGYINRKKENVIFTPLYYGDPLSDCNQICCRVARQLGESTF